MQPSYHLLTVNTGTLVKQRQHFDTDNANIISDLAKTIIITDMKVPVFCGRKTNSPWVVTSFLKMMNESVVKSRCPPPPKTPHLHTVTSMGHVQASYWLAKRI
jgi:hypothetical protein